jgi:Iap family predicted aminopeptidase
MRMREYLQRLASSDQQIRRQQLLAILTEIGCTFTHHHDQVAGYRPENIAVRFHTQWPRLVIGAHYDSICGSTGANDNAAAVCVLLALLHSYSDRPPAIPLDVVFFDLEEHGSCGSQAYIARLSASTTSLTREILAMVNLDICGVGNTILCGPAKHACTGPLAQPLQETQRSYPMPCHILPLLPASDDRPFEKAGIPNISVCIVPAIDVDSMIDSMHALSQGKRPQTRPSIHLLRSRIKLWSIYFTG